MTPQKKITPYLYIYKSFSHFLPDLVLNQIRKPHPITEVITKVKLNISIFFPPILKLHFPFEQVQK